MNKTLALFQWAGIAIGAFATTFLIKSCRDFEKSINIPLEDRNFGRNTEVYFFESPKDLSSIETYTIDSNDDGRIDAIGDFYTSRWHSEDFTGKRRLDSIEMSPEVRDKATEYHRAGQELAELLTRDRYARSAEEVSENDR
jgi:hypothetical protein